VHEFALRPITPADLPHLVALDDDPQVMRYLNGGRPADRLHIEQVVLPAFLAASRAGPHLGVWVVEGALRGRDARQFLGWVSLRRMDPAQPATATLGFRFKRASWGRGVATAAARSVLTRAFDAGEVERVVATTYQDNVASQHVLEKLGFALVGRFRPTLDEVSSGATYAGADEVWDGDELAYELTTAPTPPAPT